MQECSLCNTELTEEEGFISFNIGILPYNLCPYCWSGLSEAFECRDHCIHCGSEHPHSEESFEEE